MNVFLMFLLAAMFIVAITDGHKGKGKGKGKGGKSECVPDCVNGECRRALQGGNVECCCSPGYQGTTCEDPVCSPGCKNGGTCTSPGICTCPTGYSGTTCEPAVCSPGCKNGGTPTSPGTCTCPTGYSGTTCGREYKGCYVFGGSYANGTPDTNYIATDHLTVQRCQDFCKGFSYFALYLGSACICGDDINPTDEVDDSECNMPCTGDAAAFCGGNSRISIYQVTV